MDNILSSLEEALKQYSAFPYLCKLISSVNYSSHVNLLAIGKSAYSMAQAATDILINRGVEYDGYLLTKYGNAPTKLPDLITFEAGHPVPDSNNILYSRSILGWLSSLPPEEDIIILLSGGGSALFELPEGRTTLDDLAELNKRLLNSGMSIANMNAERSKFSRVKGGKALKYIACKRVFCYALSDVEGNNPTVIASAPFFPAEFAEIASNYYIAEDKAKQQNITYHIVGDNQSFMVTLAESIGMLVTVHPDFITTTAEIWSQTLADFAKDANNRGIHIFGGETPLTVTGTGKGGRCTQIALDFALRISGYKNISLITYATDGSDNLSSVGGAIVDGDTIARAKAMGLDAESALFRNDAFSLLNAIGAIIAAFPYSVNVNDVFVLSIA
ncbi:MAG: hydroxypyruvate reductase [Candidatus Cloacimonetes bacterium HGW-Cloacimonetes-3]|nr:MAG: hydroxypyruvate reductase [Candidatus Cloacimonetes bacterium HGW-Cloacimonetes-3]